MKTTQRWKAEFIMHKAQVHQIVRECIELRAKQGAVVEKPSILVLDDNKLVQVFLKNQLELLGCEVIQANNAMEAFQLYQPHLHLVLIDLDLPDLPGVTVANWIRRQEMGTDQHIPLIGHTSLLTEETEYRCFVAGMDTAIEKLQNQQECQSLLKVWLPEFMKVN